MMPARNESPYYTLKAVVRQTGLKPDTLRAWERRYGLPTPDRSSGGHRLYSRRDIETIKWLMARQGEGLSIRRAVDLWRQLEEESQDPLAVTLAGVLAPLPAPAHAAAGESLVQLRQDWVSACLAFDEQKAEQVLSQAFALYTPEVVAQDLLQKAMAQVGDGWYRGEVMVQQEHFCSELAIRRLEALILAAAPPTRSGRILVGCPPQEHHVFSLLLLTLLLRRRGWPVVYLGANVPAARMGAIVAATNPQLLVLAAQRLHSAARLIEMAQQLKDAGVPLAYGGLVFNLVPGLRARVPGHFLGERLELAPQAVEALMAVPRPLPSAEPVPDAYRQAHSDFLSRQGLIEADLMRILSSGGIDPDHLNIANRELGLNISAALALGDMEFLGTDVGWVQELLSNHGVPAKELRLYLTTYHQAAEKNLGPRAAPVVAWLGKTIAENGFSGAE
jgi:DNA-binding transcriptional MerR regulator